MNNAGKQEARVGSIILVPKMLTVGGWLGLVVDKTAGEKWLEHNPSCVENDTPGRGGCLVRVLGQRFAEGVRMVSLLPPGEPDETEIVHWVRLYPTAQFKVLAGPDVDSVETFLDEAFRSAELFNCNSLEGVWFLDLKLVVRHLRGVILEPQEMSLYERKYAKMLEEVLPRQ